MILWGEPFLQKRFSPNLFPKKLLGTFCSRQTKPKRQNRKAVTLPERRFLKKAPPRAPPQKLLGTFCSRQRNQDRKNLFERFPVGTFSGGRFHRQAQHPHPLIRPDVQRCSRAASVARFLPFFSFSRQTFFPLSVKNPSLGKIPLFFEKPSFSLKKPPLGTRGFRGGFTGFRQKNRKQTHF